MSRRRRALSQVAKSKRDKKQAGVGVSTSSAPSADAVHPELFTDPHHVRGDARMVASLISLGVIPPAEAEVLLRRAAEMAKVTESPREYAALVKVLVSCAKLELDSMKASRPGRPSEHAHLHVHATAQQPNAGTQSVGNILSEISRKVGLPQLAERCSRGEFGSC